jgi:hypothetical protein
MKNVEAYFIISAVYLAPKLDTLGVFLGICFGIAALVEIRRESK